MNKLIIVLLVCFAITSAQSNDQKTQQKHSSTVDEVVVESSLSVKKKPTAVRAGTPGLVAPQGRLYRSKRQFNFQPQDYGSSQAAANAASQGQHFGPQGFGASAANAQAQAFESHGPLGGFGASSAGAGSQGFNVGPDGFRGSAGLSGSQSYNLPSGQKLSLAYSNTFAVGPDGNPTVSNGNSLSFT